MFLLKVKAFSVNEHKLVQRYSLRDAWNSWGVCDAQRHWRLKRNCACVYNSPTQQFHVTNKVTSEFSCVGSAENVSGSKKKIMLGKSFLRILYWLYWCNCELSN